MVGELIVPRLPEISGIFISAKKKDTLYFTERSNGCVMKIKLSNFMIELDKLEKMKLLTK